MQLTIMASKFVAVLVLALAVSSTLSDTTVNSPISKSSDISGQKRGVGPESSVTITVGEKPNFLYTANGHTYSDQRVAVSGEYLNDEINGRGYADLYLVVASGIRTWRAYVVDNTLRVDIYNFLGDFFEFQVLVPYPVLVQRDVGTFRFNETAILASGPSRSYFFPSGKNAIVGKNYNAKAQAPAPAA